MIRSTLTLASLLGVCVATSRVPAAERVLELELVDAVTKEPLSDATVGVWVTGLPFRDCGSSGVDGRVNVPLPPIDPEQILLRVERDGYVPWRRRFLVAPKGEGIPAKHRLELHPAATLGGLVVDGTGQPIAGATVYLSVFGAPSGGSRVGWPYVRDLPVRTDERGGWRSAGAPREGADVRLRVEHPLFLGSPTRRLEPAEVQRLRALDQRVVLDAGLLVEGVVRDTEGQPVAGATIVVVRQQIRRSGGHVGGGSPATVSADDGRFRMRCLPVGKAQLFVEAASL